MSTIMSEKMNINNIDDLVKENERFYKDIGTKLIATYNWISEGAIKDLNVQRIQRNWYDAVKIADENWKNTIKEKVLRGFVFPKKDSEYKDKELSNWLDDLVCIQAHIIWILKGKKKDCDTTRMENDYYEAKRYIAFLIANDFLNRYMINKKDDKDNSGDCFKYLRNEYIYYLISLSVEDYIKISAYLQWGEEKKWEPISEKNIIDTYYYNALQNLGNTHFSCQKHDISKCLNLINKEAKNYIDEVLKSDEDELDKIVNAKRNVLKRINAKVELDELEEYTKLFYTQLNDIFNYTEKLNIENAVKIIKLMQQFNYIPNMFEYILRCFICCALGLDESKINGLL